MRREPASPTSSGACAAAVAATSAWSRRSRSRRTRSRSLTICSLSWPWSKAAARGPRLVLVGAVGAARPVVEPPASVDPRLRPAGIDDRHVVGRPGRARARARRTDGRRCGRPRARASTMPYLDVAKLYAGCSGQSADACTLQIHGGVAPAAGVARQVGLLRPPDRRRRPSTTCSDGSSPGRRRRCAPTRAAWSSTPGAARSRSSDRTRPRSPTARRGSSRRSS